MSPTIKISSKTYQGLLDLMELEMQKLADNDQQKFIRDMVNKKNGITFDDVVSDLVTKKLKR